MEYEGRHISSTKNNISINFRASKNTQKSLNILKNIQIQAHEIENTDNQVLNHKIINENGAAYIYFETNFSKRPLKLMVDTGASITILANDMIESKNNILNYIVKLYGIVGGVSVQSTGLI